jgi:hypothetical protein
MGRLNLGRRFLGLRPFSYTKVGLAELVNKPEAEFEVVNCWCAAVAVGRGRDLSSRCLAQSCHWLTQQRGSIDDRYRGSCSHGLAHVSP